MKISLTPLQKFLKTGIKDLLKVYNNLFHQNSYSSFLHYFRIIEYFLLLEKCKKAQLSCKRNSFCFHIKSFIIENFSGSLYSFFILFNGQINEI